MILKYFIEYLYDPRKEQDQGPRVRAARPDGKGVRQPATARDPRLSLAGPRDGGGHRKRDRPLPGQRLGSSPSPEGVRAARRVEGRNVRHLSSRRTFDRVVAGLLPRRRAFS